MHKRADLFNKLF